MSTHQLFIVIIFLSTIFAAPCYGEIFKYKDENGKWQFSDKPPAENKSKFEIIKNDSSSVKRSKRDNTQSNPPKNLVISLESQFPNKSPIERATLAVVSIKNPLGVGTGFFVSSKGYIVTNRHVVRPTTASQWEKSDEIFQENISQLLEQKKKINRRQKELNSMSKELERYRKRVKGESGNIKSIAHSDYIAYKNHYHDLKKNLKMSQKTYQKNKKRIDKQKSDFNFSSTIARTKRRFEIRLKDNSVLQADLVLLSRKYDLALLKIKGYITPFVDIKNKITPRQGSEAYAVGSPLGLRDFVTSGTITNVRAAQIFTDTQILPGNSGGPLIDPKGRVIGVNTLKLMADKSIGSAGFGVAIPIEIVETEFGHLFNQ